MNCIEAAPDRGALISSEREEGSVVFNHVSTIRINLIALCRQCHQRYHDGKIKIEHLLCVVAEREGLSASWIEEEIWRLRRNHATTTAGHREGRDSR